MLVRAKGEYMRPSSNFPKFSGLCGALIVVAGCSTAGSNSPSANVFVPNTARTQLPAKKSKMVTVFVADWDLDAVYAIQNGATVQTLPVSGPQGLAVDAAGNLYVTDVAYSNVLVYAPPYNGSPKVLDDAGYRPSDVAVDTKGNVAVTSVTSNSYGPGSIAFYPKGATEPSKTIVANSKFAGDYFCAFDSAGNLFVDSKSGNGPFALGEVVGGIVGKNVAALTTANILANPAGLQVASDGRIVVLDQSQNLESPTLYAYDPPKGRRLGKPVSITALPANDATAFAFEGTGDQYAVTADVVLEVPRHRVFPDHQDAYGQMQVFNYPAGGSVSTLRLPLDAEPVGVAVSPAAP
jgi:hypothetical protein